MGAPFFYCNQTLQIYIIYPGHIPITRVKKYIWTKITKNSWAKLSKYMYLEKVFFIFFFFFFFFFSFFFFFFFFDFLFFENVCIFTLINNFDQKVIFESFFDQKFQKSEINQKREKLIRNVRKRSIDAKIRKYIDYDTISYPLFVHAILLVIPCLFMQYEKILMVWVRITRG